ncbi:hypothetical protein FBU30_000025 [Linnemannia zychae]|nr:hypothetical protein FBU30_000025 [Linnemannia zychae]
MLPLPNQTHELAVVDSFALHPDQPTKLHLSTPTPENAYSHRGHIHQHSLGQGQTLAHPSVTLHSHHQQQQNLLSLPQVRPDSPTSLEDSLSEGSVDSLSIDSADSTDSVDMPDILHRSSNARRPSSERNPSSSIHIHPVSPSSNGLRTRNDPLSKKTLTPRHLTTFDGPMMATPPLSPTRQLASCESTELSTQEPSQGSLSATAIVPEGATPAKTYKSGSSNNGHGGYGNGGAGDRRRNQSTARSRAESTPPTAKTTWPARPPVVATAPVVAVEPPRIPSQRPTTQPVSAWNSLLTGVSPVRVNPRPVVRPSSRPSGPSSSSEQRRHQDVPILLSPEREGRLTMEMYSLFETILPTEESHQRRTRLISKIEKIIETEWPGQDIRVLPFGSTINDLGTNTSDVDICILTSWLGLQGVEMLAQVFRKHGMENVFCVPGARVPIVKLWDPELFAIEFDYDHHVVSIRHGCYLTKESKGWHLPGKHYRLLCVEEPFDTSRNLGNSCDMASSKGLKHEFRRALDILNHNGNLDQVCEQWIFPLCYYHNSNNGYRNSNGNGHNNNASLGRRYGTEFRPRSHARDTMDRNGNGGTSDSSSGSSDTHKSSRTLNSTLTSSGNSNNNNNMIESSSDKANRERRPRSSSASVATLSSVPPFRVTETSLDDLKELGAQLEKTLGENAAAETTKSDASYQNDDVNHQNHYYQHHHHHNHNNNNTGGNRRRRSSVHSLDSTSMSQSTTRQSDRSKSSGTSSSSGTQRRSRSSAARTNNMDGSKPVGNNGGNSSQNRQKNGRSGAANQNGGHGNKAPRATVELCLADIAKTTPHLFSNNKSEMIVSDSSDATIASSDTADVTDAAKKKKTGKKSLLWSTNSNRGETSLNHHHYYYHPQHHSHRSSRPKDHDHSHSLHQETNHLNKTRMAAVPGRVDEAGPQAATPRKTQSQS